MSIHRVTFTGVMFSQVTIQNVVCFANPDGALNDAAIAAELRDNWCTMLAAGQVNTFGWRNISVSTIGSNAAPFNLPIVVNGQDGVAAQETSPVISVVFRILTGIAGKRGRGRIYLPAYRSSLWGAGQLNTTGITNMTIRRNAIFGRYIQSASSGPLLLGICKKGGAPADFIQATDISLKITPGIQRRRNLGVGI